MNYINSAQSIAEVKVDSVGVLNSTIIVDVTSTSGKVDSVGTLSSTIIVDVAATSGKVDSVGVLSSTIIVDVATANGKVDSVGVLNSTIIVDVAATSGKVDSVGVLSSTIIVKTDSVGVLNSTIIVDVAAVSGKVDSVGVLNSTIIVDVATANGKVDSVGVLSSTMQLDVTAIKAAVGAGVVRKVVLFNNTGADVDLFTVTGAVKIKLYSVCTAGLDSAAGCNIGLKAGTHEFIAATDCTTLDTGEIWNDISPTTTIERFYDAAFEYVIGDGADITLDVEGAKQVDSGTLEFYIEYTALSSNGAVVAV
jgi:hypothetical protein